jgi:hypothetical protein
MKDYINRKQFIYFYKSLTQKIHQKMRWGKLYIYIFAQSINMFIHIVKNNVA